MNLTKRYLQKLINEELEYILQEGNIEDYFNDPAAYDWDGPTAWGQTPEEREKEYEDDHRWNVRRHFLDTVGMSEGPALDQFVNQFMAAPNGAKIKVGPVTYNAGGDPRDSYDRYLRGEQPEDAHDRAMRQPQPAEGYDAYDPGGNGWELTPLELERGAVRAPAEGYGEGSPEDMDMMMAALASMDAEKDAATAIDPSIQPHETRSADTSSLPAPSRTVGDLLGGIYRGSDPYAGSRPCPPGQMRGPSGNCVQSDLSRIHQDRATRHSEAGGGIHTPEHPTSIDIERRMQEGD